MTCAGPPVPMDDQPDGPRGTRRGNEDPIDNGAPHVRDLMRFHETERGLLRFFFFLFYVLGLFLYVRIEERKKEEWSKQ